MRSLKLAALLCAFTITLAPLTTLASVGATWEHVDATNARAWSELPELNVDDARRANTSEKTIAGMAGATEVDFSLGKVIAAPFRGIAKLFGGGKKEPQGAKDEAKQTGGVPTTAADLAKQPSAANAVMPSIPTHAYEPAASSPDAPFMPLVVGVPNDPISQGRALITRGLFEEAISELSVAAATGTNLVEANNLLGLAYDHRGEHARAQEFYGRALTLAPRDAHVISNYGYSLYLDDRYKDALAKLKLAVRLDPSSPEIYNNLGFVYSKLGKFDDAFRSFTQAGGDLYACLRTASLLEDAGRDREAIRHYEAARKLDPTSTDVLRHLITLYNRTGQRDKAEAAERFLDKPNGKTTTSTTD